MGTGGQGAVPAAVPGLHPWCCPAGDAGAGRLGGLSAEWGPCLWCVGLCPAFAWHSKIKQHSMRRFAESWSMVMHPCVCPRLVPLPLAALSPPLSFSPPPAHPRSCLPPCPPPCRPAGRRPHPAARAVVCHPADGAQRQQQQPGRAGRGADVARPPTVGGGGQASAGAGQRHAAAGRACQAGMQGQGPGQASAGAGSSTAVTAAGRACHVERRPPVAPAWCSSAE